MSRKSKNVTGAHRRRIVTDAVVHIFLFLMCVVWLIPLFWLVMQSLRGGEIQGPYVWTFLPTEYTLNNYVTLFTDTTYVNFLRMFLNTLIISVCSCVISTFIVLAVSYCTSRLRFGFRKAYLNFAMVITMFPGFMTMVAVYYLLKAIGLTEGNKLILALILCFSAGSGTQFYILKGYMDTIPKALDEAAILDGCTRWQIFTKITIPLSKPMIVYQIMTSFMAPWVDFVFAKVVVRANSKYYTVSIGLWNMLERELVGSYFTRFCAGAVLVSIPIATLYLVTQKFYQEAMNGSVKG